ncbi:HAD family hydrolase [Roseibacterium sp. SDUM158017]|uniref:HAD family hydrolase n=1 Tax=Roseicyclus salinarum TaxID=3036773 RepID=UPI002415902F|nr:HAD family hydrolase [Roseibacterium sp. SDUM158017]MDG4648606.1 HAD family hydrolase [Roseibacterium sp. SDUM158017]
MPEISAILFDKDGTLFDFEASWAAWTHGLIEDLSGGSPATGAALAEAFGFDLARRRFLPSSPVIAGTFEDVCAAVAPLLPGLPADELALRVNAGAAAAPMVPSTPLAPLLARLRAAGLKLGVATNATAAEATAHLQAAGIAAAFDYVAGCDTGHGAKPGPGMCLAFAAGMGLDPAAVLMVGDSLHDLHAGRAAGMRVMGVLSGVATEDDLAPHADAVLPHIGHLPDWLEADRAGAGRLGAPAEPR